MPNPEFSRRTFLVGGLAATAATLFPGCRGGDPAPEARERERESKRYLIVSRADGTEGAHYINPQVDALIPGSGEVAATLAQGSTDVHIARGGRYVGLMTWKDDAYDGNYGISPVTMKTFDVLAGVHATIMERTFKPDSAEGEIPLPRRTAIDNSGAMIVVDYNGYDIVKYSPSVTSKDGNELPLDAGTLPRLNDPHPKYVTATGELAVAEQTASGISILFYHEDVPEFIPKIEIPDESLAFQGMEWAGRFCALSAWNKVRETYQVTVLSRDNSLSPVPLLDRYNPRFSQDGKLVAEAVLQGSPEGVPDAFSVYDQLFKNEKVVDGFRDPLWINNQTILARQVDTGDMYEMHLDSGGSVVESKRLSYTIPDDAVTQIIGIA